MVEITLLTVKRPRTARPAHKKSLSHPCGFASPGNEIHKTQHCASGTVKPYIPLRAGLHLKKLYHLIRTEWCALKRGKERITQKSPFVPKPPPSLPDKFQITRKPGKGICVGLSVRAQRVAKGTSVLPFLHAQRGRCHPGNLWEVHKEKKTFIRKLAIFCSSLLFFLTGE